MTSPAPHKAERVCDCDPILWWQSSPSHSSITHHHFNQTRTHNSPLSPPCCVSLIIFSHLTLRHWRWLALEPCLQFPESCQGCESQIVDLLINNDKQEGLRAPFPSLLLDFWHQCVRLIGWVCLHFRALAANEKLRVDGVGQWEAWEHPGSGLRISHH